MATENTKSAQVKNARDAKREANRAHRARYKAAHPTPNRQHDKKAKKTFKPSVKKNHKVREARQLTSTIGEQSFSALAQVKVQALYEKLADFRGSPEKLANIIHGQMARAIRPMFLFAELELMAEGGERKAEATIQALKALERKAGVDVATDDLEALLREGVVLGRVYGARPQGVVAYYQGRSKEGTKPYITLAQVARAVRTCEALGLKREATDLTIVFSQLMEAIVPAESVSQDWTEKQYVASVDRRAAHIMFQAA